MLKSKVPYGGHNGFIYLNVQSWYEARDICRMIYHGDEHEPLWREMTSVEPADLAPGGIVYWREPEWKQVVFGTVKKLGEVPTKPYPDPKPQKARKSKSVGKKDSKRR